MPQSSAGRKHGGDQSDGSGSAPKSQRAKTGRGSEDNEKKSSSKKLKDVEISVPIVYGTISFWLGKKANEYHSHKWSVYVRGATNEDLSSVVKKVVFQLHPSFNNPTRTVESPPFELQESGWGEFEIQISLHFHSDVSDKQLDLYHHLKLYPEVESGPQSTKKPVVVESYDEIVFHEPSEGFFARVQNHPAVIVPRLPASLNLLNTGLIDNINEKKRGDTKDHPYNQWFTNFSEADELLKLAAARQQVQAHIVKLKRQLTVMDGQPQQSKPISGPLSWGPDNFSTRIVDFANTRAFAFNNVCDGSVLLLKVFHSNVYGGSVSDNNDGLHFFQISTMTMIRIYLQAMGTVQGMSSLF